MQEAGQFAGEQAGYDDDDEGAYGGANDDELPCAYSPIIGAAYPRIDEADLQAVTSYQVRQCLPVAESLDMSDLLDQRNDFAVRVGCELCGSLGLLPFAQCRFKIALRLEERWICLSPEAMKRCNRVSS